MRILLNEDDALTIAKSLARSRGLTIDFDVPFAPDSAADKIYTDALRAVSALLKAHDNAPTQSEKPKGETT